MSPPPGDPTALRLVVKPVSPDGFGAFARTELAEGDLEKARILLSHMLDHNQHHEEEMAALAKRFTDAGDAATAKKIRSARARMVEANLALMEAVSLAAPKAEETSPAEKEPAAPGQEA